MTGGKLLDNASSAGFDCVPKVTRPTGKMITLSRKAADAAAHMVAMFCRRLRITNSVKKNPADTMRIRRIQALSPDMNSDACFTVSKLRSANRNNSNASMSEAKFVFSNFAIITPTITPGTMSAK